MGIENFYMFPFLLIIFVLQIPAMLAAFSLINLWQTSICGEIVESKEKPREIIRKRSLRLFN
jgi:hypothetical protein